MSRLCGDRECSGKPRTARVRWNSRSSQIGSWKRPRYRKRNANRGLSLDAGCHGETVRVRSRHLLRARRVPHDSIDWHIPVLSLIQRSGETGVLGGKEAGESSSTTRAVFVALSRTLSIVRIGDCGNETEVFRVKNETHTSAVSPTRRALGHPGPRWHGLRHPPTLSAL